MIILAESIKDNNRLIQVIKAIACIVVIISISRLTWGEGIKSYYSYKDYEYQNNNTSGETVILSGENEVKQLFTSKGNIIDNVSVYYADTDKRELKVSIETLDGKEVESINVDTDTLDKYEWNKIGLTTNKVERGTDYYISLASEDGLYGIVLGTGESPEIFKDAIVGEEIAQGRVLVGINFTYSYITLASAFEFAVKVIFSLFIVAMLCLAAIYFEKIYASFAEGGKQGVAYAIFFSVSTVLLYNPIDSENTKVLDFKRIIGTGLNADVDVSRRTDNFNVWFIALGILFILFFLLSNYFLKKKKSAECSKVLDFLNPSGPAHHPCFCFLFVVIGFTAMPHCVAAMRLSCSMANLLCITYTFCR